MLRSTTILLALALALCGCGALEKIYDGDTDLSVYGTPSISDGGYTLYLDFEVPPEYPESIQRITMPADRPGWEGVESHRQEMFWPDVQSYSNDQTPWYHERVNTVSPGETAGAPWATPSSFVKGVVMLDGWLDENGKPVGNRTYFRFGGKQGGVIVREARELGFTYKTQAWSGDHPENPIPGRARLVLTVPGTDVRREWSGDGP